MFSVRGIGVAVSVSTSTWLRKDLIVSLCQPVRADDDVHGAGLHTGDDIPYLLGALKARQYLDTHGPVGEAVAKVLPMLLRQQGGRYEHGDLLAAVYGHKARSQRNFGLAEADVTADDAIHGLIGGEVAEHVLDRLRLVFGELEREAGFEIAVVGFGPSESVPGSRRAPRIDVEQLGRDVTDLLDRALPGLCPLIAAEAVQRRILRRGARVP